MSFTIIEVCSHRGMAASGVHLVLFLMFLASLSILLERLWVFYSARAVSRVREAGSSAEAGGLGRCLRRHAMERVARAIEYELGRGLRSLLTLSVAAPLVGTLGTLAGLAHAFRAMALSGSSEFGAFAMGFAEALFPFLYALLIGIPSFWAYACFRARVERTTVEMSKAIGELELPDAM